MTQRDLPSAPPSQQDPLELLFTPRSVAVVGVSPRPGNLASNIVHNLVQWGYGGAIYPVGRSGGEVHGHAVLREIDALPRGVDLACVLTPARTVLQVVDQLAQRGVRTLSIQTGGFDELDHAGRDLAQQLKRRAARHGMRMVGPNCIGTLCTEAGLCTPFAPLRPLSAGPVAVVSQSGGVLCSYLNHLDREHLGLSRAASIGNKLDVDEADLIELLGQDPKTRVICLYLEDIRRGRQLLRAAARCPTPVVLHKSNRSPAARRAAASHTAAMLSDYAVVQAAARQAGLVLAEDTRSALTAIKGLLLPPLRGKRLAVLSRSGGHAVIAADSCARWGFELPELPASLARALDSEARAGVIRAGNPLDLGDLWDLEGYPRVLEQVCRLEQVDGVLFAFVGTDNTDPSNCIRMANAAADISRRVGKPIATCLAAWSDIVQQAAAQASQPVFHHVEHAAQALACAYQAHARRTSSPPALELVSGDVPVAGSAVQPADPDAAPEPLPMQTCFQLLEQHQIPAVQTHVAADPQQARQLARELGGPLVLKLLSPQVVHKSDSGAVRLGLHSADEVALAAQQMLRSLQRSQPRATVQGFALQRQAPAGQEMIVGFRTDPAFGPVLLVGFGGVLVELLSDVSQRLAPVSEAEALEMLRELRGSGLLAGARGSAALDSTALAQLMHRFSHLAAQPPAGVVELELNPVLLYPEGQGCLAVDARGLQR